MPVTAAAAMVTWAGTVTPAVSLDTVTDSPPAGAAAANVIVQTAVPPAGTKAGAQLSALTGEAFPPPPPPLPGPPPLGPPLFDDAVNAIETDCEPVP